MSNPSPGAGMGGDVFPGVQRSQSFGQHPHGGMGFGAGADAGGGGGGGASGLGMGPPLHASPGDLLLTAAAASGSRGQSWAQQGGEAMYGQAGNQGRRMPGQDAYNAGGVGYGAGIGIDPTIATRSGMAGDVMASGQYMSNTSFERGMGMAPQDQPREKIFDKVPGANFPRMAPPLPLHLRTQASNLASTASSTFISPVGSDDDEQAELLGAAGDIAAPLQSMDRLAQAAVERARLEEEVAAVGSGVGPAGRSATATAKGKERADDTAADRPPKRRKLEGEGKDDSTLHGTMMIASAHVKPEDTRATGPVLVDDTNNRSLKGKRKKPHIHAYPDVVALGLVPEAEAKELFDLYFAGSSSFTPVYDPTVDTWEALRVRSPFSISTIVAVGARVRDGGGYMSETHRASLDHARKIAIGTMFTPVARVEAVQAMTLLAAYNDNGWLPSGHAVRMAVDMGLDKCFMKLVRMGMGAGKTAAEVEDQRPLVIGARVWFFLYLVEHQMSYGTGRPAIVREDDAIIQCRRFLDHPLSILTDARLVSTVEMIALRAPLHVALTTSPEDAVDQDTIVRLQQANVEFDKWKSYWDKVFTVRFSKSKGDFFRESLQIQVSYSCLFINSQLLRGVSEAADVKKMSKDKREMAIQAMRAAQSCLDICVRGANYRNGLRYGACPDVRGSRVLLTVYASQLLIILVCLGCNGCQEKR